MLSQLEHAMQAVCAVRAVRAMQHNLLFCDVRAMRAVCALHAVFALQNAVLTLLDVHALCTVHAA